MEKKWSKNGENQQILMKQPINNKQNDDQLNQTTEK